MSQPPSRTRRHLLGATAVSLVLPALPARAADATPDAQEAAALQALFERQWDWAARSFPEFGTYRGEIGRASCRERVYSSV